jgi:two-component sensor histidine kinase
MRWNGDDLLGTIDVLTTPAGNIVKELIKNGIKLGVSSRGVGSVKESFSKNGATEVEDDYSLICFDIVSNPSTHGAFLTENANFYGLETRGDRINTLVGNFFSELNKR